MPRRNHRPPTPGRTVCSSPGTAATSSSSATGRRPLAARPSSWTERMWSPRSGHRPVRASSARACTSCAPDDRRAQAAWHDAPMAIAPDTTIGPVELTVADQDRSRLYYEQVIGLRVLERADSTMSLGVDGAELLVLVEEPGARPALGHTGLFHFALLLPERPSLARWLAHAARE